MGLTQAQESEKLEEVEGFKPFMGFVVKHHTYTGWKVWVGHLMKGQRYNQLYYKCYLRNLNRMDVWSDVIQVKEDCIVKASVNTHLLYDNGEGKFTTWD